MFVSGLLAESFLHTFQKLLLFFFFPHVENLKLPQVMKSQMLFQSSQEQVTLPAKDFNSQTVGIRWTR